MSTPKSPRVCVAGAGIIGVCTAVRLQEASPEVLDITLIAREFSPETTGDLAAGYIQPYAVKDSPEKIARWTRETMDYYRTLLTTKDAPKVGIRVISSYILGDYADEIRHQYVSSFPHFHELSAEELATWPAADQTKGGCCVSSLTVECKYFIPYLMKRFKDRGGKLQQRTVRSLNELVDEYDVIINCTGVWAHDVTPDPHVYPIRGQIIRVKAPWINYALINGSTYIISNLDNVVLGGTTQKGNWSLTPDHETRERIWKNCTRLVPSLEHAEIVGDYVGLRPGRDFVRLEIEHRCVRSKTVTILHNYGHGGSGITVCWGAAGDAVGLLLKDRAMLNVTAKL